MIIGTLDITPTHLETHNDSYLLSGITAVSTRRPFLSSGLVIGGLTASSAWSFREILYPTELMVLLGVALVAVVGGWSLGQLLLVSRDLRGSPIAEAVYGTYRDLNKRRPQIATAIAHAKAEPGS